MLILGLETSCDETAAAVVADGCLVRSNVVASQHELHEPYRGVVPEIASRAHLERLLPVVHDALAQAHVTLDQIDAIAVGNRPGLIGSLIVGVSAAKALAWQTGKPLIGVNHVKAHLHAAALQDVVAEPAERKINPDYRPSLGLVVSGGHTSLYLVHSPTQVKLLGATIDDAVGEAYDKAAVILDLGYPGGPRVDQAAQKGDANSHQLPRSLLERDSLDFSFSGLKTALLYAVCGQPVGRGSRARFQRSAADLNEQQRHDLAAAFQQAVVDTLIIKIERAVEQLTNAGTPPASLIIGGGVSANSLLRQRVMQLGTDHDLDVHIPALAYCVDNASMIAGLAYHQFLEGKIDSLDLPAMASVE